MPGRASRSPQRRPVARIAGRAAVQFDAEGRLRSIANVRVAEHRRQVAAATSRRTVFGEVGAARAFRKNAGESGWTRRRWPPASQTAQHGRGGELRAQHRLPQAQRPAIPGLRGNLLGPLVHHPGSTCWPCAWRRSCSPSGSLRSGGLRQRLFIGIVFALGSAAAAGLHPAGRHLPFDFRIVYAMPPAIMLGVSLWLFKRRSAERRGGHQALAGLSIRCIRVPLVVPGQAVPIDPRPPEPESARQQADVAHEVGTHSAPAAAPPAASSDASPWRMCR